MKEFVLLNAANVIIEKASLEVNLSHGNDPGLSLIVFEGDAFIGDKIENGAVIPVTNPSTGRGKEVAAAAQRVTDQSLREQAKQGLVDGRPLTRPEVDRLFG